MSLITKDSDRDSGHTFNWLMLLGLTVIGLAVFTMLDYGNNEGKDGWRNVYNILIDQRFLRGGGRPFAFIFTYPYAHVFGVGFPAERLALIVALIANAYLVFRLVALLRPADRRFAAACGILSLTFFVRSTFLFESIFFTGESLEANILTLLALVLLVSSLTGSSERRRVGLLLSVVAAALAWTSIQVRESPIPVLIGLPVFFMLFYEHPWPDKLWQYGLWYGSVFAGTLPLLTQILGGEHTRYGTSLFTNAHPGRLLRDSVRQFDFAFHSFPLIPSDAIGSSRAYLTVALICVAVVLIAANRWLSSDSRSGISNWKADGLWLLGGLVSAWLGFSAFLTTIHARSGYETQVLAQPAEAVVLASIVWLLSAWIPQHRVRWAVRVLGVLLISVNGLVIARQLQVDLKYEQEATWENVSSFMRTLGSIAPDSDGPIVFVYTENKPQEETPFVYGWGFQFAVRYFFEDKATGIHLNDSNVGTWEVRDEGIWFAEPDRPHLYDWQHVIFITRTNEGDIVVLSTIPDKYFTPERQAQCQPFASIEPGYIPARIQETFPVIRSPDPIEK